VMALKFYVKNVFKFTNNYNQLFILT